MIVYAERFQKIIIAAFAVVLLSSCSAKKSDTSSITIVLPSASSHKPSQSVSALGFNFPVACFAVNVTGPSIPQVANSCSPAVGVFSGFKPPGSTVSLEVPMGSDRKIEVYLFNRASASDACPSDFSALTPDKVVSIGSVGGIEMNEPNVSVTVNVSAPAGGVNLITQSLVPNTCVAAATPTPSASGHRLVLGTKSSATGGGFVIEGQVTSIRTMNELSSPSGHKMLIGPKGL